MTNRIVFMLDYKGDQLQIGGTPNYVKLLAPRVRDAGFDVRVAMPYSPRTDDLLAGLRNAAVPVDDVDTSPQAGHALRRLHTAYSYFSAQCPDIVHFVLPWWNACEPGILGARMARVPVRVATYQAFPEAIDLQLYEGVSGAVRQQRHRFTCNSVHKAISVSELHKRRLVANGFYSSHKITVIKNMVELNTFARADGSTGFRREWGVDESQVLITVIGYFEEIKGHRYLLQALPNILRRHPNVVVAFVGDGLLKASLQAQVRENQLVEKVVFAGWHEDVPDVLAASDLLVLPSLSEGLPFVVPEAMASGLPVVATRVGGIPEAVVEGKTGFLAEPASALGLQDAIVKMLQDPERMRSMGKAGQARARAEFDVEWMVSKTCEIYRSLLGNPIS